MKVVFVVLHYCQVNVTLDCIESLLGLKGEKEIVVVDNASPDGSGAVLEKLFINNDLVHVILNDSNLGFASANNVGYAYAKKELKAAVIVVLNNDTVIEDVDIIEKLITSNLLYKYHIIAPDIINKTGEHQNPFALKPLTYIECIQNYRKLKLLEIIYSIPILGDIKAKYRISPQKEKPKQFPFEMIVPHGAAIIYSPMWIDNEDIAFFPGTFLYLEEELLFYYAKNHHYQIIFSPILRIHHMEDVSTNSCFKDRRKKALFLVKNHLKSYKVLMNYLRNNHLDS